MSFAIATVIRMTVVLTFAGLSTWILKRSSASIRSAVWTIALLSGLLLPLADSIIPTSARMSLPVLPAKSSEALIVRSVVSEVVVATASTHSLPAPAPKTSGTFFEWFAIAWVLGVIFFLGRLMVASLSAQRLARSSMPLRSSSWTPLMDELRIELGVSERVELRDGGETPPLTSGLLRHTILLPSDADAWSPEQQRAVLAHELAHARRYDGIVQFLVQVVCSIYWINPIVWLAARRLRLERERACDDCALNAGARPRTYADHLLDLATGALPTASLATASIAHTSQLEARLRTILSPNTKRGRLSRWTAVSVSSLLMACLFIVSAVHLTSLLSLSLPTSFAALAAPRVTQPVPEPAQQPTALPTTGTVAGQVVWTDGAVSSGATVSAIATTREGLPTSWIMGTTVAGRSITDSNGQYRIANLPAGLYHIVTGPVNLPRTFSDVSRSDSTHLAAVTAGKTVDDMNFACVRNAGGVVYDPSRVLTVTGKLVLQSFGGPSGPVVLMNHADGSVSHWQFRNNTQSAQYWWPGLDAAKGGVIEKMATDGEVVTVTGIDIGGSYTGRWPTLHVLIASEVTRGGVPAR